jgi:nucleoside-diphosphate-sugar epimerase
VRVLVTGATGFTGGHLAARLAACGHEVRALVRDEARGRGLLGRGVATLATGDLARPETLFDAVRDVDIVYNVAALYRQAGLPDSMYRRVNAEGVARLVEAASAAGVRRVVHCSTVGVHGDVEHPPADERAPLSPGDVYQATKLEGERLAAEAAARTGVELTIARPTGIYGPGDRRLLKLFRGVARRRFVMLGSGRIFYHLTYVTDIAEGLRLCGEMPQAAGRTYLLAGPEVTTLAELVTRIARHAGVQPPTWHLPVWPIWIAGAVCEALCRPLRIEPPLYRRRVDFFTKSRSFRIDRARRELGFEPAVGLDEGIARTLAWYREQGWL